MSGGWQAASFAKIHSFAESEPKNRELRAGGRWRQSDGEGEALFNHWLIDHLMTLTASAKSQEPPMLSSWEKLGDALSSGSLDEALVRVRVIQAGDFALSRRADR